MRDYLTPEYDTVELPVERSGRALSCDGSTMELPMVMSHMKHRAGSLASLGPMPSTLLLSIDKWGLDDAHKDKLHKAYSADLKVSLIEVKRSATFESQRTVYWSCPIVAGQLIYAPSGW